MQYGDEYLADLDYIDVCETQKEGYESDVEESEASDKDYKQSESITSSDDEDDDFKCDLTNWGNTSTIGTTKKGRSTTRGASYKGGDKTKSKKSEPERKRYSIREDFFNEDFAYSLDAKKMGNIGRYLNHSCQPNCFVQNVFVDTHDLRFPWVSFFAMKSVIGSHFQ